MDLDSFVVASPRRGKRAARLALAIGDDADVEMLKRFVANPEVPVFRAHETARIRDFFRWVTYSVQVRTKSRNPDAAPLPPVAGPGAGGPERGPEADAAGKPARGRRASGPSGRGSR